MLNDMVHTSMSDTVNICCQRPKKKVSVVVKVMVVVCVCVCVQLQEDKINAHTCDAKVLQVHSHSINEEASFQVRPVIMLTSVGNARTKRRFVVLWCDRWCL